MAPSCAWKWTPAEIERLAEELRTWAADEKHLFLKEFTAARGIPASYIARFSEASPVFGEILETVSDILEVRLIRGGLDGRLHHAVVKLVACSKYGYSESMKTDMALTATTAKPLTSIADCDRQIAEAQAQKTLFENMAVEAQQLPSAVL